MAFERLQEWIDEDDGGPLDWGHVRLVLLNMTVYLAAALQLGISWWKCVIITLVVGFATGWNYGHRALARFGVLLLVLTLGLWSGVLPPIAQWQPLMSGILAHL